MSTFILLGQSDSTPLVSAYAEYQGVFLDAEKDLLYDWPWMKQEMRKNCFSARHKESPLQKNRSFLQRKYNFVPSVFKNSRHGFL